MILGVVVWGTLTVLLVALAMDSGKLIYARSELRDAVDAAAIASAQALSEGGSARQAAEESASDNSTKSNVIDPKKLVVQVGNWNFVTRVFTPNGFPSNAVAVDTEQNYKSFSMGKPVGGTDSDTAKLKAASIAAFQRRDVVLVLDISGSMLQQDKISAMKRSVKSFNRLVNDTGLGRDRVAVLTYSDTANWLSGFTSSVLGLDGLVDGINANGATNIGDGLKMAIDSLQSEGRTSADRQILLLTDGLANRPPGRRRRSVRPRRGRPREVDRHPDFHHQLRRRRRPRADGRGRQHHRQPHVPRRFDERDRLDRRVQGSRRHTLRHDRPLSRARYVARD